MCRFPPTGARGSGYGREALALVGSYELLMMIIRSAQQPRTATAHREAPERMTDTVPLQAQAVLLAAGRVPLVHAIRTRLHVGQPSAQRVRAYLTAFNDAQASVSLEHRAIRFSMAALEGRARGHAEEVGCAPTASLWPKMDTLPGLAVAERTS